MPSDNRWNSFDNAQYEAGNKLIKESCSLTSDMIRGIGNAVDLTNRVNGNDRMSSFVVHEPQKLLRINCFSFDDDLHKCFEKLQVGSSFESYALVGVHSDGDNFITARAGANKPNKDQEIYSPKELSDCVKSHPRYHGESVLLFACNSGKGTEGAAQGLADHLGVSVIAPGSYLYMNSDGHFCIADNDVSAEYILKGTYPEKNRWLRFNPRDISKSE